MTTSDPMEIDKYNMIFRDFPPVWNIIKIPPGMVVYRATNTNPKETNDPRFFSEYSVAYGYKVKYNGDLYECVLKPGIKLCDIRTLRYLVLEIMLNLEMSGQLTNTLRDGMKSFMYAFGLFSHTDQIGFIGKAYPYNKSPYTGKYDNKPEPFTNIGSRISYGVVDDKAVLFLKALLGDIIDGYISPVLTTPWHGNTGFSPEICLFTPKDSLTITNIINGAKTTTADIDFKSILISGGYKYLSNTVPNTGVTESVPGGKSRQRGKTRQRGGLPQIDVLIQDRHDEQNGDDPASSSQAFPPISVPTSLWMVARAHDIAETNFDRWKIKNDKFANDTLEQLIEQNFRIQCELSKNNDLKNFMVELLKKMTNLLYETFEIVTGEKDINMLIRTIKYHYRPQEHIDADTRTIYVLKPGINKKNQVVDYMVRATNIEKIVQVQKLSERAEERVDNQLSIMHSNARGEIDKLSLSEIMGALYGILTHAGMFTLMFQATIKYKDDKSRDKETTYPNIAKLKGSYEKVVEAIGTLFGSELTVEKMSRILDNDDLCFRATGNKMERSEEVYDVKKGNMRNIIMDMMVNNPITTGNVSIVRKNLNNQEYIRTRVQKSVKEKPDYKVKRSQPKCPIFYSSPSPSPATVMMVEGDEWYAVTANGFFRHLMDSESRIWKAGPSGSTFMWMNMVFDLLMIPRASEDNYKLLLLCIIADFVPMYHSLPEVLLVYSRENPHTAGTLYTLDQNPIEWLRNHLSPQSTLPPISLRPNSITAQPTGTQPMGTQPTGTQPMGIQPTGKEEAEFKSISLDPLQQNDLEHGYTTFLTGVISKLTPSYEKFP